MTRETVELSMQRARAELQAAKGRAARHAHLVAMAATHGIELPAMPIGPELELAVARAVAILDARGIALDPHLINPPTVDQILAGPTERRP